MRTRNALLFGFGGLLLLLLVSGLDAVQALAEMRASNQQIRREFVARSKQLEAIRAALYLSGTYVRDYLLEPDPSVADRHRGSLREIRTRIESELRGYEALLRPEQRGPFNILRSELGDYWRSLNPVLAWDAPERRQSGYAFVRDEVFPRRTNMLSIADRIAGVNEQELAAGERRVNDLFSSFRTRLLLVLGATVGMGLILAATSMRLILSLERQTREHLADVTRTRAGLRELSARLVDAQEQERKAISRELHDAVGQSLSAVLFELRNLAAALPRDATGLSEQVDSIRRQVEASVGMLRHMALLLRPSMLDDLGLIPALEWQAREVSRRTGVMVNLAAGELPEDRLSEDQKTCIFRIVQEALNNIVKHADAKSARITVRVNNGAIELTVQDDGKGFDPARQKGLGLVGIEERVVNLDGTVRVESQPGRGTLLTVSLPVAAEVASE